MTSNFYSKKTVVVAKSDPADYTTIGEAIKNAQPETRILVKPGIYRESIVIDKSLEILGDGKVSDIVIEATNLNCILMQTDYAIVRGFTLRESTVGVCVPKGQLILEDCDLTAYDCGIVICGSKANPIIRRCCIHDGQGNGIQIKDNGQGVIEDCDIYGNTYSGVYIDKVGNPTIGRCRIYDGKKDGIWITYNGLGTIEDCDIYGNTAPGVDISKGSNPTFRRCQLENHPFPGSKIEKGRNPFFRLFL
ncbi:MAG: hypothetical protein F6K50_47755 [Moorea sp. SIO3I7]|nr:hypothetical protein [Moorena sp. SIO3I7]